MKVGSLCTGIGGLDLGLEWSGMKIIWQAEINEYCKEQLEKHWPGTPNYGSVCDLDPASVAPVDLLCGGYPCQPFSLSGKRKGKEDDRHLWPEFVRILHGFRELGRLPAWCLFENVAGHVSMGLDSVLSDLERIGYSCWPLIIPACAVGSRSQRDRVWIVAHAERDMLQRRTPQAAAGSCKPLEEQLAGLLFPCAWPSLSVARTYRAGDGLSSQVHRNRALGNAVFPKLACFIGLAIMEVHKKFYWPAAIAGHSKSVGKNEK